jgi:PAS domain S-box-containing protein
MTNRGAVASVTHMATAEEPRIEIQESFARYEALFRVSRAFGAYRDPKELFHVLASELRQVVRFDFMVVFLYDQLSNTIRIPVIEVIDGPGIVFPPDVPVEETITWWVYHHQQPVVISSWDGRFPRMMEVYKQSGVESVCLLPLTTVHRRLGSLGFGAFQPGTYTEEDVRYLSLVADQVALAVDNALRNDEQHRSEAFLEQGQRLSRTGSWAWKVGTEEVTWSREHYRIFGFDPDKTKLSPRTFWERVHPQDRQPLERTMQKAMLEKAGFEQEFRIVLADGSTKCVYGVGRAVLGESGDLAEFIGTTMDITERKQAEEGLRRSEAYLAEGQRLSHTGSWARQISNGRIFWSQEMLRIFGCDPDGESPTEEAFLQKIHPEDRTVVEQIRRAAAEQKTDFEYSCRIVLDSGATKYVRVLGHPIVNDADELFQFVGTVVDVTEQHESRAALEKAFEEIKALKDELYHENIALREEIDEASMFEEIVGRSEVLRHLLTQVETVAPTDSTVLIYGETGTGKELVARAIHNLSSRSARALVKVNCAAIPTGLLESELFGHERGAFTGAVVQRIGRFELANQSTVFLDEVGEIPLELQPKLLRVLQEKEFERLGSTRTLKSDARLIAATNRDLAAMVDEQTFRSDLYYRLNVFPIRVPALRERPEDIPLLVQHFAQQFARRMRKTIESIPSGTMKRLCEYSWPGNIRELQNVIERAVILSSTQVLNVLTTDLTAREPAPTVDSLDVPDSARRQQLRRLVEETDRNEILHALRVTKGRVGGPDGAAAHLGLKRTTLLTRMKKLGIHRTELSSSK